MPWRKLSLGMMAWGFLSQAVALQLVPAFQLFKTEAGGKISGEFTVTNDEGEEIRVTPSSKNWFVLPANTDIKAEDWLVVNPTEFYLKDGESKTVPFTAKAPKHAVGELVGMVSFLIEKEVESQLNIRMSAAVYLAIQGTEKFSGDVEAITVNQSSGTLSMGVIFRNTGNVHIRPRGTMEVYENKGRKLVHALLSQGGPTYPGAANAYYTEPVSITLKPGSYGLHIMLGDQDTQTSILDITKNVKLTKEGTVELRK